MQIYRTDLKNLVNSNFLKLIDKLIALPHERAFDLNDIYMFIDAAYGANRI